MTTKRLVVRSLSLLALACAIVGCQTKTASVAELPPPAVSVSQPVMSDIVDYDHYEGRVASVKKVELRTKARGFLTKIDFRDGDIVEQGKLLFVVDPRPYEASLEAAQAQEKAADGQLEFAKSEYARVKRLVAEKAASREEMEMWLAKQIVAKADKEKAKVAIRQAQLELDYTQVKAPFSGRLSRTQVNEGALINSGGGDTLLTTIVSIGPTYVYFNIDERALLRYRREFSKRNDKNGEVKELTVAELKIPVQIALDGEEGYPHPGVIDYADPFIEASTGTGEVRAKAPNKTGLLKDGNRARVRIPVSESYKAMLITERAIGNEQGRKFVYVVDADNEVKRRDVVLDRVIDGMQVVRSGLKADEWVVVNGIQRVRENLKVEPRKMDMPGMKSRSS